MNISYKWLQDHITTDLELNKICDILTDIGLEVEGNHLVGMVEGNLSGVVVGEVLTVEKHPNADKLKNTSIKISETEVLKIVCGASNVAAGQRVAVATVGTILYPKSGEKFKIQKSKIRGEESFGMLCAEDELGIGENHEGIMLLDSNLKPGTPLSEVVKLNKDTRIEIGLTPNRADAMSHYGVARDLYVALKARKIGQSSFINIQEKLDALDFTSTIENPIKVKIEATDLCKRYVACYVEGIQIGDSPDWLKEKLEAIGLKPQNNIVDITNYVLHDLGQPMHAFDAKKIDTNTVTIKKSNSDCEFTTLDGEKRKLAPTDLLISDGTTPLAIAGIMGGLNSSINKETTSIYLEAAYFDAVSIRKTSKRLAINSDASFRFERGIDPNFSVLAMKKAISLLKECCPKAQFSEIDDTYPTKIESHNIVLRIHKIDKLLGIRIHRDQIKDILSLLEIEIISENGDVLDLMVPAYRVDVTREVDLIEELLRIYGYNNIDVPEKISFSLNTSIQNKGHHLDQKISQHLVANGFFEVMNNSLSKEDYISIFDYDEKENVVLQNPLSKDLSVMRRSLLPGLLENVAFNSNRKNGNLKLFELGKSYSKEKEQFIEKKQIGLLLTGKSQGEHWGQKQETTSFFELKAQVNNLLKRFNITELQQKASTKKTAFKDALDYLVNGRVLVSLGTVNPILLKCFGLKKSVLYAEFDYAYLLELTNEASPIQYQAISKFPGSRKDLALLLDKNISYSELYEAIQEEKESLIKHVNLFDVYEGNQLPDNKKSYALSFYLQDEEKTITDKQIEQVMKNLITTFTNKFKAELR